MFSKNSTFEGSVLTGVRCSNARRLNQSLRGYWENSDAEIGKNLRNQVENSMFVCVAMTVVMVGGWMIGTSPRRHRRLFARRATADRIAAHRRPNRRRDDLRAGAHRKRDFAAHP